jgi:hypothetical protein
MVVGSWGVFLLAVEGIMMVTAVAVDKEDTAGGGCDCERFDGGKGNNGGGGGWRRPRRHQS